jgi:hypothetical protein
MKDPTIGHCPSRDDDLEMVREKLIKVCSDFRAYVILISEL